MKKIRMGMFETNSSSTHSITMCMESDMKDWESGKRFYIKDSQKFISAGQELDEYLSKMVIMDLSEYKDKKRWYKGVGYTYQNIMGTKNYDYLDENGIGMYTAENLAEITQEQRDKWLEDCDDDNYKPMNAEEYWDSLEYETYKETFITPSGEKVVAFGYYGQDM